MKERRAGWRYKGIDKNLGDEVFRGLLSEVEADVAGERLIDKNVAARISRKGVEVMAGNMDGERGDRELLIGWIDDGNDAVGIARGG